MQSCTLETAVFQRHSKCPHWGLEEVRFWILNLWPHCTTRTCRRQMWSHTTREFWLGKVTTLIFLQNGTQKKCGQCQRITVPWCCDSCAWTPRETTIQNVNTVTISNLSVCATKMTTEWRIGSWDLCRSFQKDDFRRERSGHWCDHQLTSDLECDHSMWRWLWGGGSDIWPSVSPPPNNVFQCQCLSQGLFPNLDSWRKVAWSRRLLS